MSGQTERRNTCGHHLFILLETNIWSSFCY